MFANLEEILSYQSLPNKAAENKKRVELLADSPIESSGCDLMRGFRCSLYFASHTRYIYFKVCHPTEYSKRKDREASTKHSENSVAMVLLG